MELEIGNDYAILFVQYIIDVFQDGNLDVFEKKAKQYLSDELEKKAMTIAQQLRQEGRQEGRQDMILSMINAGMEEKQIAKIAKIKLEELKKLIKDSKQAS